MCRLPAGRGNRAREDGGFSINVGMRSDPAGVAALVVAFAVGLSLQWGGRHDVGSTDAEPRAEPSRMSGFGTIHPERFDVAWASLGSQISDGSRLRVASLATDVGVTPVLEETERRSDPPMSMRGRVSFDERFLLDERFVFDQRLDSFDQRFAAAAVSPSPSGPRQPAVGPSAPRLASLTLPQPASPAKKIRLAALEMPKGSSLSLDADSRTAIYDITARTVYMPDGRRLEAHSGLGSHMDDPRYVNVKSEGPTPPNVYDLSLRENLFHGVRAIRLTPAGDGKMFGRAGILAHSYLLGPSGQSNGCVSFSDYPAFLNAFLRGEVTRLVVVERLATPPSSQFASEWLLQSLKDLFSGPERTATSQPERANGYAAVSK